MTLVQTERRILQLLRPSLEAEGYSFVEFPAPEMLPKFFEGYRPDAVALGKEKNLAIEIKVRKDSSSDTLRSVSERFRGHPDWELRVVYGDGLEDLDFEPSATTENLERYVTEADELLRQRHFRAALILGWSLIEAIARQQENDLPRSGSRTTRQAIEVLESAGKLAFDEARNLRQMLPLRAKVVHGDFGTEITSGDVEPVLNAARAALAAS